MDALIGNTVTPISTNAPALRTGETEWAAGVYAPGDLVTVTTVGHSYRCVYATTSATARPDLDVANYTVPKWQDMGPMNQQAAYDGRTDTITQGPAGNLVLTFSTTASTGLWVGNISGANDVRLVVKDPGGNVVYDQTRATHKKVTTAWDWCFAPFQFSRDIVFSNIPLYTTCTMEVTLGSVSGASVGMVTPGITQDLGTAEWGADVDFINYSPRSLDTIWGPTEGTGGTARREVSLTSTFPLADADSVANFMDRAKTAPCVWVPHEADLFRGLRAFGQASKYDITYNNVICELNATIQEFL